MDRRSSKLWDIQSKGASNNSPKAIGKELVTLYKNYLSDIDFDYFILFLGGVSTTVRIDDTLSSFGIDNIKPESLIKLKDGLKEEGISKTYIDTKKVTDGLIDKFLEKVTFIIDDKCPSEYVRGIIKDHPHIVPEEKVLNTIFNELRDEQSAKKNGFVVEGVVVSTSDEALNYYRHLTNNEIRLMTLQRIISRDPLSQTIPFSFIPVFNQCPPEKQKDLLDECQSSLCRALFNRNAAQGFWTLFEHIYLQILDRPNDDLQAIYRLIDNDLLDACPDFDTLSTKYFISIVKDGIQGL